ncbi:MAG: bifunctional chorismate mutase/prephenate dehydratase [Ruminococcaceae bacterium]|nr:bifunctional chorismate mutase/prephenate dehydratase [Oscillospiraceae bacterium]
MELSDYRVKIDEIDSEIVRLFKERMEVSRNIAECKREKGLPVYDPKREREKLVSISGMLPEEFKTYGEALYSLLFELSRAYQHKKLDGESELTLKIKSAVEDTAKEFPPRALVACQGVEGAYSSQACDRIFKNAEVIYFDSFEGVFSSIANGLCSYGVIPLENSTAGSVNRVYDLMMKYDFNIVRSVRIKVDHSLLANKGVKLDEIREIYSHPHAIAQCESFLKGLNNVKVTPCENTAMAAKMVFESKRRDEAAISSDICSEIYGLNRLCESIQDTSNNYTRFICISKNLEIFPGADRTSIMMVLKHKPGALSSVLSRLYSMGINLLKLESRPLPNSDFEFMFYFDLETSVYSKAFAELFNDIEGMCTKIKYLGSYNEVV